MTDKIPAADQRQSLEATHTWQRLVELRLNPVKGTFDAAHLREINRRIFQDLPGLGFDQVTPGEYRPRVLPGNDWIKTRRLETVGVRSSVAYSSMDDEARKRLEDVLKRADPVAYSKLSAHYFTLTIGRLYSEVDYIHPFPDGNSRTLREFTRQLAEASGYSINWERFNQTPAGRDILYIARDLSVNELAMPHIIHEDTKRSVILAMDQFEGNRALPDLLRDVVMAVNEPSLEDQLVHHQTMYTAGQTTTDNLEEPSLEAQLCEQEEGGYRVKFVLDPVEGETASRGPEPESEPGMES